MDRSQARCCLSLSVVVSRVFTDSLFRDEVTDYFEELIEKRDREKLTEQSLDDITGKLDKIKKYFEETTGASRDELSKKSKEELVEYIASEVWKTRQNRDDAPAGLYLGAAMSTPHHRVSTSVGILCKGIAIEGLPELVTSDKKSVALLKKVVSKALSTSNIEMVEGVLRITCTDGVIPKQVKQLKKTLRKWLREEMKVDKDVAEQFSASTFTDNEWRQSGDGRDYLVV